MHYTDIKAQSREAKHCCHMKMLALASGLTASVLVFSCMLKVPQVHAQTSCNYYASPNGTGNGLSASTPFQISKFWSVATPGKTLCLLDGTYTGENSMIRPPATFAGTAAQPITIRALNDGQVRLNGGTSRPVDLQGSYGILQGVNVFGGDNTTLMMRGRNWIARRIVAWNNDVRDIGIVSMSGYNNTLEDCAAFGVGRKTLAAGADGGGGGNRNNTVRRCWVRWENRLAGGSPTNPIEMGYAQDGVTLENVLATRDLVPGGYENSPEPPFELFRTRNSRWLGSISYVPSSAKFNAGGLMYAYGDWGYQSDSSPHANNNVLLKDIVAYISPSHPRFGAVSTFQLYNEPAGHPQLPVTNRVENLVGVGGGISRCEAPTWQGCATMRTGTSLAQAIGAGKTIWTAVPGVCKRYVNGVLTNEGLWPWPMNQRIKDALVQSGRSPVDVTQTMEDMFGPINQACKTDTSDSGATFAPRNLRITGAN